MAVVMSEDMSQFLIGCCLQTSLPPKLAKPSQHQAKTIVKQPTLAGIRLVDGSDLRSDSYSETDEKLLYGGGLHNQLQMLCVWTCQTGPMYFGGYTEELLVFFAFCFWEVTSLLSSWAVSGFPSLPSFCLRFAFALLLILICLCFAFSV